MGNTYSSQIQDKTSYFMVPESPWDHLEVSKEKPYFNPLVINTSDLWKIIQQPLGDIERSLFAKSIITAIQEYQFFIIQLTEDEDNEDKQFFGELETFFTLSKDEKIKYEGFKDTRASGYQELVFDNRDNIRDKEIRDVFQIRMGEEGTIPWPSENFRRKAYTNFDRQWNISMIIMSLVLGELHIPFNEFEDIITGHSALLSDEWKENENREKYHESTGSNLSLFRYVDTQNYNTEQKCMIHQDNGFITLLPKSTLPGIHILHDNTWYPMEEFTKNGEMLCYFGASSELFSKRKLTALRHRVVRKPGKVRYSMPFEIKANANAEIKKSITGDSLEKAKYWERIQSTVGRSDTVVLTA